MKYKKGENEECKHFLRVLNKIRTPVFNIRDILAHKDLKYVVLRILHDYHQLRKRCRFPGNFLINLLLPFG
jgi:hypothetical protein